MPEILDRNLRLREGSPIEGIHVEFPDEPWNVLTEFIEHVDTLFRCRAMDAMHANPKMQWTQQAGLVFSGRLPADDDVAMMLHRMRPFVLTKESTYLPKVCNVLSRYITHTGFRQSMKAILDEFLGKSSKEEMKIDCNGTVLNADGMVNNWLNGFEYHHAQDAKQALEIFKRMLPETWQRAIFISMMIDKAGAVGNTSIVVRWLGRRDNEPLVLAV